MSLVIDTLGGMCPVQAEGTIDGVPFYFRARGEHWKFSAGIDPVKISLGWAEGFFREEEWGDGPFSAGYMPLDEAQKIIEKCAAEFQQERKQHGTPDHQTT